MPQERVQKILAQAGIDSRRKCEELVAQGLVTINGKVAKLGDKAEWGVDHIKVDGKLILKKQAPATYAFYKPRNVIASLADPSDRPCLKDYLNGIKERLFPVGRLDFTSEGILLLTNDGELAQQLQSMKELPRVYEIKVRGTPTAEMISRVQKGYRSKESEFSGRGRYFRLEDVRVRETLAANTMIEVVLKGSGSVDLEALFEERGFLINRMLRKSYGHVSITGMSPGELRLLTPEDIEKLLKKPEAILERRARELAEEEEKNRRRQSRRESEEPVRDARGEGTRSRPSLVVRKRDAGMSPRGGRDRAPAARDSDRPAGRRPSTRRPAERTPRSADTWRAFGRKPGQDRPERPARPERARDDARRPVPRAPRREEDAFDREERSREERRPAPAARGGASGLRWGAAPRQAEESREPGARNRRPHSAGEKSSRGGPRRGDKKPRGGLRVTKRQGR